MTLANARAFQLEEARITRCWHDEVARRAAGAVCSASGNLFDAGAEFSSVELWYDTDWHIWTTSVPTLEVTNPPYDAYYWSKYDHFAFWKP